MRRLPHCLAVYLLFAAQGAAAADESTSRPAVTGSVLDPGLGQLHHQVSTRSGQAQRFFEQGLKLTYALNHEAAVQSFQRALQFDPNLAMAYWGIALTLGPDINIPMSAEHQAKAYEAIEKAQTLAPRTSPIERDYIQALSKRYAPGDGAARASLDAAYRDAMAALSAHYPDDVDAMVLYAESQMILHAWKWWRPDGTPEQGTAEAVAALRRALRKQPNHIGANHYYVHAVEMSPDPGAALASAHRLETLAPSAGHLVHMPAHIYMRTGEYLDAARVNEVASLADQHVHPAAGKSEYLPYYHGHNLHFLAVSYSYAGASGKAMDAARRLVATVQPDLKEQPEIIDYYCSNLFQVGVLFDRWSDVLGMEEPPADAPMSRAFFHFARSMALAGTGHPDQAQAERARVAAAAAAMGPKDSYGMSPVTDVMAVALPYLDGRLAWMAGDFPGAAAGFRQAAGAEDRLAYDEPPDWYLASNWMLGRTLLRLGDATGAEAAFRADLRHNVAHGRSLHGLEEALRRQGRDKEADATRKRFERAWRGADLRPADL